MTTAVSLAQSVAPGVSLGFKNRIINGAMMIDQRNAGASVTVLTTTGYTLDRWTTAVDASSKFSVQQVSDAPEGFTTSLKATSLSAYTPLSNQEFRIGQFVEGFNFADFGFGSSSAKTATLSFWVKSSLTGTFGVYVANYDNTRTFVSTYAINTANTWEQKTVTITGDTSGTWLTNNGRGIQINFELSAGSNYFTSTTNSWTSTSTVRTTSAQTQLVSTNAATWQVTGVQLEKGSTATSFDYRPYGTELSLCQRYAFVPNGNASVSGSGVSSTTVTQRFVMPIQMRSSPTASVGSSGSYTVTDDYSADITATTTNITAYSSSQNEVRVNLDGFSGITNGRFYAGLPGGACTSRFVFSSEL